MQRGSLLITGLSGAGKATALAALERCGVECVDNLPADLVGEWVQSPRRAWAAAVVDARQGERLHRLLPLPRDAVLLFLEARDLVLLRRLGESTRPHPCAHLGSGLGAIAAERALVGPLRAAAHVVLDTSDLSPAELAARLVELLALGAPQSTVRCTVTSFGFKYGPLLEADWVLDVRSLRNPFWDAALRPLSGLDQPVRDAVLADPACGELLERAVPLLTWAVQRSLVQGRRHLAIGVGCTGGQHRSVVVAARLAGELARRLEASEVEVAVRHRDLGRARAAAAE